MSEQEEMGSTRRRKRNSGRVEWNTPATVIACSETLEPIGLDPCWNARSLVRPRVGYDLEAGQDGLTLPWTNQGLVYVNPPYGAALKQWVPKIIAEGKAGAEIIVLVPNSTETVWFRKLFCASQASMSWEGRLTFDGAPAPAFFGSVLFYFGHRPYAFADAFSAHAYCIKLTPKMERTPTQPQESAA